MNQNDLGACQSPNNGSRTRQSWPTMVIRSQRFDSNYVIQIDLFLLVNYFDKSHSSSKTTQIENDKRDSFPKLDIHKQTTTTIVLQSSIVYISDITISVRQIDKLNHVRETGLTRERSMIQSQALSCFLVSSSRDTSGRECAADKMHYWLLRRQAASTKMRQRPRPRLNDIILVIFQRLTWAQLLRCSQ